MKTQTKTDGKRMNHDRRGQKGSLEVKYLTSVIDLNWQKMNERQETRKPYDSLTRSNEPVVTVRDAYPNLGEIFGDRIIVRGSPEYYF